VRRLVDGLGVHERRTRGERRVEHLADRRRIVLPILVHRHDPVGGRACHPRERRCVLAEVPRKPYGPDIWVSLRQFADRDVGSIRTRVVDEHDLADAKRIAVRRPLRRLEEVELLDQWRERVFAVVDGDNHADRVLDALFRRRVHASDTEARRTGVRGRAATGLC
jgi:hypothetical protein